ncbi:uncharacterized protein LOC113340837 [Papaver somniferum]|uniref:uncharacterized protein LOC113340837 n=1 Tax=Papaver somniferum TaxID=3469 RepID=UPI000E6F9AFA|nr:uncharacterized protein LOC113340837 [Papaver somniferum]
MASISSSIKVPVFEGKNFEHWRIQMENIFKYQEVWDIVDTGYVEPEANAASTPEETSALQENRKKNAKATYILHQGVHESLFDRIVYISEAKKAWDALKTYYKGSDKVKKVRLQTLRRKYELLQMESSEKVSDFFSRKLSVVNEMKSNGDIIQDAAIVEKILRSLPETFEAKVTAIEECNSATTMSLDEILGHFKRECPEKKVETRNNANFVEKEQEESEVLLLACFTAQDHNNNKWYLDTGCSNHMYGMKELFVDLDESLTTNVKFGNNETVPVMGKGKIGIILKNGAYSYILDVYYVPGLLIVVEMVSGLPAIDYPEKKCESCIFGKQHRKPFLIGKARIARQPLELIHSDLCSPMEEVSRGGNRYCITFIDDFSRKTWVYLLKLKSEAANAFKNFKVFVEKQSGKKIKILRTDRGTGCLLDKTPEEALTGRKPSVRHLKVFGCIAYAHIPTEIRKKLDNKSEKCIFLGYSVATKGYKLYNPETRKMIISRDVIFDESSQWDWNSTEDNIVSEEQGIVTLQDIVPEVTTPTTVMETETQQQEEEESTRLVRNRVAPIRLEDYVVTRDDEDEDLINFPLFGDSDPINFEEASQTKGWREAMDDKIQAIEKNKT